MRPHFWLAGLATLATISSANAAQDIEVVANSILRTYSDYCDPLFFDQNRAANALVDPTLAHAYAGVLLTREGGQCDRFLKKEALPAVLVPQLLARTQELQNVPSGTLSSLQLSLLGAILLYDDMTTNECSGKPHDTSDISGIRGVSEAWWNAVGRDDILGLAKGYVEAEIYARAAIGLPFLVGEAAPCGAREAVGGLVTLAAIAGGFAFQPAGNAPTVSVFDKKMMEAAPGTEGGQHPEPDGNTNREGPDGGINTPTNDYEWEPGDPSTSRGDGGAIDLSQHVSAADADVVTRFSGRWGTTAACDEPGGQYMIGQFNPGEPDTLGVGVPRIQATDLACEMGQFQSFGDAHTFNAICWGEGDTWNGTGSMQSLGDGKIRLYLFNQPDPIQLVRCR